MKTRYVIAVSAVLLAVCGMTIAQPQSRPAPVPTAPPAPNYPPLPDQRIPPVHFEPVPVQPAPTQLVQPEAKPDDMTIDQLLDAVDRFREQKSELDKKEKAFLKVLHKKADKLKERIDKLDGGPPTGTPPLLIPGTPGPSIYPNPNSGP